jgi:hypothetical protein
MKKKDNKKAQHLAEQQELSFIEGLCAAEACAARAERESNFDTGTAALLIVQKLRDENKPMSCEDLVDWCRKQGQIPHKDKAFGAVFKVLSNSKQIERAGIGPRRKGHGTMGAAWWRIPA